MSEGSDVKMDGAVWIDTVRLEYILDGIIGSVLLSSRHTRICRPISAGARD